MTARIAVLGAGLAGLAAATRLVQAGHDVTVYEARDRPGGRLWSVRIPAAGGEHVIERGAEFVLDGYTTFRRYAAQHDLELVETGMSYYVRTPADRPGVATEDLAALGQQAARAAAAGTGPRSVADVLDQIEVTGPIRDALQARIEMSTAVRIDQVTAEGTLDHVASFEPLPSWRIGGGNQSLPNALAAALGDRIRFETRVESVTQTADAVTVAAAGHAESFDVVVVALPFGIITDPQAIALQLPDWKHDAFAHVVQGNAAKIHLALDEVPAPSAVMSVDDRFWTWTANESGGKVAPVLNGFGGELGHLTALGADQDGAVWEQRVRALRTDLPLSAAKAVVTAWPFDPLAAGGYTAHAPGFSAQDAEALAAAHGRVHFAGEYIDPDFPGLMEGALRSGDHAADAIITTIRSTTA